MLKKRLISSVIVISVIVALIVVDFLLGQPDRFGFKAVLLCPLAIALVSLATKELLDLFGKFPVRPDARVVIIANAFVMAMACVPAFWGNDYPVDCNFGKLGWALLGVSGAVGILFVAELFRYLEPGESITRISLGMLCVGYLGLLATFLAALRFFGDNGTGMAALLSMVIIAKFSDAGAYASGKLFGRHKMSPKLSPNKTIEGAVGAIVCGCGVSVLLFYTLIPWVTGKECATSLIAMIIYGALVTVAAMVGDLSESLLKRDAQQKDSSRLLPGLGGALDIVDSILVAAPVAFVCWAVGLVG